MKFILRGPDYKYDESPGLVETLLPWPVRLAIIAGVWVFAWMTAETNTAAQLGWTLEYAGVIAISLLASFWFYIFLADIIFSLIWLALTCMKPPDPERDFYLYWSHQVVELINRQLTHIQAFLIWMGVLLPYSPKITFQLPALLGLALVGPAVIDWITLRRLPRLSRGNGELQSARRPVIYGLEVIGLVILLGRSTDQVWKLLPLVIALVLVMLIRIGRHVRRGQHAAVHAQRVAAFRQQQRQLTRGIDVVMGPVFMLLSVIGVLALSLWVRHHEEQVTSEKLDGPPPDARTCVAEPGGPTEADISVFLLADNQVHELGGQRFPGQTELADLLVPNAVRPVELDMLGMASVAELQHAFDDVVRGAGDKPVFWAHLGDFADLGCTGELARAVEMFTGFAGPTRIAPRASRSETLPRPAKLAGVAPGNHDVSFTGNFYWSPYWSAACHSSPASKATANAQIEQLLAPGSGVLAETAQVSPPDRSPLRDWLFGAGGLVTATELGTIFDHQQRRSVVALFIDTSDGAAFDWGIAGLFGTYSAEQDDRLHHLVQGLKVENPLWVVFAHHPIGELTRASRDRLETTLAWLDDEPLGTKPPRSAARPREPRVLAVVAAHTHRAETHRLCVARRVVREIVIGSTIDSAQQGAILELGTDPRGAAALRVRTVPTVARPKFTCRTHPATIDAEACQRIVAQLKCDPSCAPLFDENTASLRACSELEQDTSFGDGVRALMSSTSPVEPAQIKNAQRDRARRLMSCVCRTSPTGGRCEPLGAGDDPLDSSVFATRIAARLATGGDDALQELACLSWAASAQQQHKVRGMTFASALRCAFDDATIPAAQESVATLDVQPCQ